MSKNKAISNTKYQLDYGMFVEFAKNNQDLRFHVRPLGYDIAGYTVEEIVEQLKY